jgi:hypothetical protein
MDKTTGNWNTELVQNIFYLLLYFPILASRIQQAISQDSSTRRYFISTWWQHEEQQGRSLKKLKK